MLSFISVSVVMMSFTGPGAGLDSQLALRIPFSTFRVLELQGPLHLISLHLGIQALLLTSAHGCFSHRAISATPFSNLKRCSEYVQSLDLVQVVVKTTLLCCVGVFAAPHQP